MNQVLVILQILVVIAPVNKAINRCQNLSWSETSHRIARQVAPAQVLTSLEQTIKKKKRILHPSIQYSPLFAFHAASLRRKQTLIRYILIGNIVLQINCL